MGNRLSKIYTRTGDDGTTGLGDGTRVRKDSLRVSAYGTVDELNSVIGVVLAEEGVPDVIRVTLTDVQHDLLDIGGEMSVPGIQVVTDDYVARLETALDALNIDLEPLKEFILPGGTPAAAAAHVARTVCRRAERVVCSLAIEESVPEVSIRYLNRLSDYLFVAARSINKASGGADVLWSRDR
jgi:cob(I)alamin adenosyltransferase